jgi:hypothetical protein
MALRTFPECKNPKKAFLPHPDKLGEGRKAFPPSPSLAGGGGKGLFPSISFAAGGGALLATYPDLT